MKARVFGRSAHLALALMGAVVALALPVAAVAAPPTVTLDPVTNHSVTTAQVSGEVSVDSEANGGFETFWCFEASPEGQEAWSQGTCGAVAAGASEPIVGELTGLSAGQSYEARISYVNFNDGITEYSAVQTFTTDPAPVAPTFVLGSPEDVLYTTAHVSGTFNPEGGNEDAVAGPIPITAQLEVNREGQGWSPVGSALTVEGAGAVSTEDFEVQADLTGLATGAEYKVRLVAHYAGVEAASGEDEFTTLAVTPPTAEDLEVTNITADSAHFSGNVKTNAPGGLDPAGEAAYEAHWSFSPGGSSGTTPATTAEEAVSGEVAGLEPNHSYTATLTVSNAGGSSEISVPFKTDAIGSDISRETLWEPTPTSIQLNAKVNAHNAVLTDCHFEYGTAGNLDQSAPCESPFVDGTYSPPADNSVQVVSARVSGLVPNSEYDFRLVATNAAGTAEGDVRSFTTLEAVGPENCPNQVRRDEQHSDLPGCRAYEMVSPLNKGQGDIVGDGQTTISSKDGDAVAYSSRNQFGDAVGSGVSGQTQYLARRGAAGWATHAITPMSRPDALQTFFGATKLQNFSDDLRTAVVWGYDLPGAGGTPDRSGIFLEDTATRALQPITLSQEGPVEPTDFTNPFVWGISDDARHLAFVSRTKLLPKATENAKGINNVYQSDDGVLSLAGILPDGSVPSGGSTVFPSNYRGAMSADGSRQLFSSPTNAGGNLTATSQLYLRIDGERTVWVSEPEGSDKSTPLNVILQGASRDGQTVFFATRSRLLDEDENDGHDLYRYTDSADPEDDENLTLISHDGDVAGITNGGSVVGFSEDAERVYYHPTSARLLVWDHGTTRVITSVSRSANPWEQLTVTSWKPGNGRVSPDGMYMAFVDSNLSSFGVNGLTGQVTNEHHEMYIYSLRDDTLRCVSCPAGPATSDARVIPENKAVRDGTSPTAGNPAIENVAVRPNFLSESGEAFFSTGDALVPEDTNGVFDAYAYDAVTGAIRLLSSGTSSTPSVFADASPSGDDVFLLARQRLVGSDSDELVDLYDARVGGGFPEPVPSPAACEGEVCQGPAASPPSAPSVTSTAEARGNLKQQRHPHRCTKKKRRAGKCRAHKHGKHGKGQHRTANADRRAAK